MVTQRAKYTCPVGGIVHVWFTSGNLHVGAIGYFMSGTSKSSGNANTESSTS